MTAGCSTRREGPAAEKERELKRAAQLRAFLRSLKLCARQNKKQDRITGPALRDDIFLFRVLHTPCRYSI